MICTGKLTAVSQDFKTKKTVLQIEVNEDILSNLDELKNAEKLNLKLTKYNEKRSLDANAYLWVLLGKIAQKVKGKEKEDIYRTYIRETGTFNIVPVRSDLIEHWNKIWTSKGVGWVTEDIGECKHTKGYHNIKCYYGTSLYDTAQMSHLIDLVVQDCKQLGIETMTPAELERIKQLWNQSQTQKEVTVTCVADVYQQKNITFLVVQRIESYLRSMA